MASLAIAVPQIQQQILALLPCNHEDYSKLPIGGAQIFNTTIDKSMTITQDLLVIQ